MATKRMEILLFTWLAAVAFTVPAVAQNPDMAVVVSDRNRVTTITPAELRRVFAGERRSWAVGLPIKLIVRSAGTSERTALLKLLGMSESEYKQYWISQIFRGEADTEPLDLPSLGMQIEALSVFPGAITLVTAQHIKPGMKVIKVNGHMPGEAGYPLH